MTQRRLRSASLVRLLGEWRQTTSKTPVYKQLTEALRLVILDGRLPLQHRLPGERELAEALALSRTTVASALAQLREEGIPFSENVGLGGMIETPAAAIAVDKFLNYLDYVSIGTNDLIQYTIAIDRNDDAVSHLYDPLHPAVLQLIRHVVSTADRMGKPVAMCGEMAGDPQLARLLFGLGLRRYSMLPIQLLKVKQQLLTTDLATVTPLVEQMMAAEDCDQIRELLAELNR